MAIGDIQHSELPDELLHEPKGASTAAEGTVYIADGAKSGTFKKIPLSSLDFIPEAVEDLQHKEITDTISLTGASLSQAASGVLTDIQAFIGVPQEITSKINQNAVELLRLYNNQAQINQDIKESLNNLNNKLSQVIAALKGAGIIHD